MKQQYLPDDLKDARYYEYGDNKTEQAARAYWDRSSAHNAGTGSKYTRARRPVALVYWESFAAREEAMRREWHIKRMSRAEKEALIAKAREL